jgi:hypothetical protein
VRFSTEAPEESLKDVEQAVFVEIIGSLQYLACACKPGHCLCRGSTLKVHESHRTIIGEQPKQRKALSATWQEQCKKGSLSVNVRLGSRVIVTLILQETLRQGAPNLDIYSCAEEVHLRGLPPAS